MNRLLAPALFLLATGPLAALDWGINVNQVPLALLSETNLYVGSLKTAAWVYQPAFGSDLRVQGEASFSASSTGGPWTWGSPTFDLTEASVKGSTPLDGGRSGLVDWSLGRRNVSDATGGWLLDSRWDGASVSWLSGPSNLSASVGYSGLLNKKTSKVAVSKADADDNKNDGVKTAPQRLVGAVGFGWTELLFRQDVQWELLGNYDLRTGANALHTAYGTLVTTGPLPGGLRQKMHATGAVRIASSNDWGYLVGGEVSATLPFLGSRLVVSGLAAQGLGGSEFLSITGKGLADVITFSTTNGASVAADFSLKPLAKTALGFKGVALFRTASTVVELAGFDQNSRDPWLGTEASLYASWTPTSESSFGLNTGIFLPQSGAFLAGTKPTILAVVTATLKL